MSTAQLMEMADALAMELLELAQRRRMAKHEFLMLVAMTERLLHRVVVFDDAVQVRQALDEADATLKAVTETLEAN